ncbi:hypothetical protein J8I29_16355 [Labrys sp. LIt4]|uniref:hypothetical protein n=1 Tax=Labrys sp. LIt4 TaxID=2821355 RepID=UPI001ADF6C32|nr:hypothetical protein [Labrys sp. LIt4]MBP0580901.1 hypothetical protein [Labrys sp. LIt4]
MTTNGSGDGPEKSDRKYLLVARIGPKSLHAQWLAAGVERNYDVFLSSYDTNLPEIREDGVYLEYRGGSKVAGYAGFLREHADFLARYKYICFFDDDIEASPACINGIFSRCDEYNLKIAQPALTWDSHFTYACLLQQKRYALRYVNFVEMMCPVFRHDILERIAPLYALGYESGIDLIWCNLVAEDPRDFAVIDEFPVRHTEPVGGNKSANGFADGRLYEDDIHAILALFRVPWLRATPFSAIGRSGRVTKGRTSLLLGALILLAAAPLRRPVTGRLRAILVHWRHLWRGAAGNVRTRFPMEPAETYVAQGARPSRKPIDSAGQRMPTSVVSLRSGASRQADWRETVSAESGLTLRRENR